VPATPAFRESDRPDLTVSRPLLAFEFAQMRSHRSPPARAASPHGAALRPLALSPRSGRTARCCVRVKAALSHAGIEQGRTAASPRGSERPVRAEPYARFLGSSGKATRPIQECCFHEGAARLATRSAVPGLLLSHFERPLLALALRRIGARGRSPLAPASTTRRS
jgi:hypothetical protein